MIPLTVLFAFGCGESAPVLPADAPKDKVEAKESATVVRARKAGKKIKNPTASIPATGVSDDR